jgi:hypothetical protein
MWFKDKNIRFAASIAAGIILLAASFKKTKVDIRDQMAADLSTGASRRNIRFNEKIRAKFRHSWLKASN